MHVEIDSNDTVGVERSLARRTMLSWAGALAATALAADLRAHAADAGTEAGKVAATGMSLYPNVLRTPAGKHATFSLREPEGSPARCALRRWSTLGAPTPCGLPTSHAVPTAPSPGTKCRRCSAPRANSTIRASRGRDDVLLELLGACLESMEMGEGPPPALALDPAQLASMAAYHRRIAARRAPCGSLTPQQARNANTVGHSLRIARHATIASRAGGWVL